MLHPAKSTMRALNALWTESRGVFLSCMQVIVAPEYLTVPNTIINAKISPKEGWYLLYYCGNNVNAGEVTSGVPHLRSPINQLNNYKVYLFVIAWLCLIGAGN